MNKTAKILKLLGQKVIVKIPTYSNMSTEFTTREYAIGVLTHIRVNTDDYNNQEQLEIFLDTAFTTVLEFDSKTEVFPATQMGMAIFGD